MNYINIAKKLIHLLLADPWVFYSYIKALLRGCFYIAFYRVATANIVIKFPFFVYYKFKITGAGSVFIDRGCSVYANSFDGLVITTLSPNAKVVIGKGCDLGGMTIRCYNRITLGNFVMSANCLLQDTVLPVARLSDLKNSAVMNIEPVANCLSIGNKVWLAGQTIVLGNSSVGDASVLGVGSVCIDRTINNSHLAVGNPISSSISIERIERMVGI